MTPDDLRRAKFFQDLYELPEDNRINLIGHYVMEHEAEVTFPTDDIPGKADRYIRKLLGSFKEIEVVERGDGPTKGCVFVKLRRKTAPIVCPFCSEKHDRLIVSGYDLSETAPFLCAACMNVSLFCDGTPRKPTDGELIAMKASPAWKSIDEALVLLQRARRASNARNN